MGEMNQKGPKRIKEQRFLDQVYEEYSVGGQQYCFILGAGASKTSGIRTGEEMMREWRDYLLKKGIPYIRNSAQDFGLEPDYYLPIFSEDYVLKNDDYFTLFDLRFAGMPNAAYAYLEKEMEGKYPSYGYYPLAMLLSNTRNRLVITTNFDSLIEDALYTYTFKHPLVVGHERLASYIGKDTRHPVIAKIHRDLLLRPLNRKSEMKKLKDEWVEPLRAALSKYIPIVIGYAGGDSTFMSLLNEDEIKLNGIYWCCFGEPSDGIKKIVSKHNGYLVKIWGFDEVMFRIGQRFSDEANFGNPVRYVQEQAERRCVLYQQNFQAIKSKYEMQKNAQHISEELQDDLLRFAISIAQYESRQSAETEGTPQEAKSLADEALDEISYGNLLGAAELYTEAIRLAPDNIDYRRKRSIVLYRLGLYEKALLDDTKAIKLDESDPSLTAGALPSMQWGSTRTRFRTRRRQLTRSRLILFIITAGAALSMHWNDTRTRFRKRRRQSTWTPSTLFIITAGAPPSMQRGSMRTRSRIRQGRLNWTRRILLILAAGTPRFRQWSGARTSPATA